MTLDLVESGAGIAFLSRELLRQRRLEPRIHGIRVREGRIARTFFSVTRRDRPPNPLLEAFLRTARTILVRKTALVR